MALTDRSSQPAAAPDLRRVGALAVGDFVVFNLVTAIGLLNHGRLGTVEGLLEVATIATPFAAGWFVVAPFFGLFRRELAGRPRAALPRVALAWLVALPLGLLLWSIVRQKSVQPAFAIITFITNLVLLLGWRGLFALLFTRAQA